MLFQSSHPYKTDERVTVLYRWETISGLAKEQSMFDIAKYDLRPFSHASVIPRGGGGGGGGGGG